MRRGRALLHGPRVLPPLLPAHVPRPEVHGALQELHLHPQAAGQGRQAGLVLVRRQGGVRLPGHPQQHGAAVLPPGAAADVRAARPAPGRRGDQRAAAQAAVQGRRRARPPRGAAPPARARRRAGRRVVTPSRASRRRAIQLSSSGPRPRWRRRRRRLCPSPTALPVTARWEGDRARASRSSARPPLPCSAECKALRSVAERHPGRRHRDNATLR
ncbi:hypothetical protein FOCC_FOCC005165 [Frankliniella occidentalis]|nr:hypothetical protein FOCC_FOCC005165 [Frankliniella occidentalis]